MIRLTVPGHHYAKLRSSGEGPYHVAVFEMLTNDLTALHERLKQAGAKIDTDPVFQDDLTEKITTRSVSK